MAINKLNLNGTTYDIGEAEGTNTAESIVEFDSADEESPSSADESIALMKSGETHKSLLEKISAGMKNIRYLLKQVSQLNTKLDDMIVMQRTEIDNIEIDGTPGYISQTFSLDVPSGYIPIGVVGYYLASASSSGVNSSSCCVWRIRIASQTSGTVLVALRNYASSTARVMISVDILYQKA